MAFPKYNIFHKEQLLTNPATSFASNCHAVLFENMGTSVAYTMIDDTPYPIYPGKSKLYETEIADANMVTVWKKIYFDNTGTNQLFVTKEFIELIEENKCL